MIKVPMIHIKSSFINCVKISSVLLVLYACKDIQSKEIKYKDLEYYTSDAIKITGEPFDEVYIADNGFTCYYTTNGFLGTMQHTNKKIVHLTDLHTGKMKMSACSFGRGPGEILSSSPYSDFRDNNLYLLDYRTDKIKQVTVQYDTLLTSDIMKLALKQPMVFMEMEAFSDSSFVLFATDFHNVRSILLADKNSNILDSLAYYPLEDTRIDQSSYYFNIDMELSPCKNYLFVTCLQYDCISKYEIKDNKITEVDKIYFSKPDYNIQDGKPVFSSKNHINYNSHLYIGDKYIYITIDPESAGDYSARYKKAKAEGTKMYALPGNDNYILVLDYDLNLVKSYLSDSDIINLATTPDPATVYATDWRYNRLVKYNLPGLE